MQKVMGTNIRNPDNLIGIKESVWGMTKLRQNHYY